MNASTSCEHRLGGGRVDALAAQNDVADEIAQPVRVGAQDEVFGTGRTDAVGNSGALFGGGGGVTLTKLGVGRLHLAHVTGFGVDEVQQSDIGELELARIDDLDGEHVVAGGQP